MSAKILVVDDNPLNIKVLAAKLMHDYYVVITAENGQQTLEKAETNKPDLILLDIMMPGMDGFETCKRLKANESTKHIPVVMVTALSDVADRVHGLEVGADDFLSKPINDMALMARVRSLLRLKMVMDEWRLREATANQLSIPTESDAADEAPARILLLEDDEFERDRITTALRSFTSLPIKCVETIDDALSEAVNGNYDLSILSLGLKSSDGLFFCSQLRANELTRFMPIILVGDESEFDRIAKGMDLGANDYIIRPIENSEMTARARTQLRQKRHHDKLRRNYEESLTLALVDPLTGAYNRRYLDVHLPRMFDRYKSSNKPIAVFTFDIDFFKKVNDTYGHPAGDAVLKEVVKRAAQSVRSLDLVARTGGEEFYVIMPEADLQTATSIGKRVLEKMSAAPVQIPSGQSISVTVSIGVAATHYEKDKNMDEVLGRADAALYRAKQGGRNRVENEPAENP